MFTEYVPTTSTVHCSFPRSWRRSGPLHVRAPNPVLFWGRLSVKLNLLSRKDAYLCRVPSPLCFPSRVCIFVNLVSFCSLVFVSAVLSGLLCYLRMQFRVPLRIQSLCLSTIVGAHEKIFDATPARDADPGMCWWSVPHPFHFHEEAQRHFLRLLISPLPSVAHRVREVTVVYLILIGLARPPCRLVLGSGIERTTCVRFRWRGRALGHMARQCATNH